VITYKTTVFTPVKELNILIYETLFVYRSFNF